MVSFIRKADDGSFVVVVCNFTPEVHRGYNLGVPAAGSYEEVFNSDASEFGGSNVLNEGELLTFPYPRNDRAQHIVITVPPLATCYFKLKTPAKKEESVVTAAIKAEAPAVAEAPAPKAEEKKAEEPKKAEPANKQTAKKKAVTRTKKSDAAMAKAILAKASKAKRKK